MDWTNERYVRLYTRDTDDWLALKWEARAVFCLMLRKVDRSGHLDTKRGSVGVAAQTGLPLEVVEVGLPDLLRDGCVTICDGGYLFPNFLTAQEAKQSDKQRAKEARARRREAHIASSLNVTQESQSVTQESQPVTIPSHAVTASHTLSHGVTLAVPSQPSRATPSRAVRGPRAKPAYPDWVDALVALWNGKVGKTAPKPIHDAFKEFVAEFGFDTVRAAVEVYVSPDEGPANGKRKPAWCAENFHHWRGIAAMPMDDGQGGLTERGRRFMAQGAA